jgi:hypothetical protein
LHLIDQIIDEVHISKQIAGKQTPVAATKILKRDEMAPSFDQQFNYRHAVGKLNFLEKSTRPDISYVTHQVARFSEVPKASHGEAIKYIVKYLGDTCNDGIILRPVEDKPFEIFADVDFVRNWHQITAP